MNESKQKINISIDDISPHPNSSLHVIDRCKELIEEYPEIKFSLFVPLAYWRTDKYSTTQPLYISECPGFCTALKALPKENFEVGYHGFFHGVPKDGNDNNEFSGLSSVEVFDKIELMEKEIVRAGVREEFKKIFRPPAWRISRDALETFHKRGFILTLSSDSYTLLEHNYSRKELQSRFNVLFQTHCPPYKKLKFKSNQDLEIVYHACEWDRNFLSKEKTQELSLFIKEHIQKLEFSFIEDMI